MGVVLRRNSGALPVGFDNWNSGKAFWFDTLGYKMRVPEVRDFHASNARIRVVEAHARSGKSFSAAHEVIPYAMPVRPMQDALIWLIGPNFRGNREFKDVFEILVERRDEMRAKGVGYEIERAVNRPGAGDMEVRIVKDIDPKTKRRYRSTILGLSAENEKMLQGEQVTIAVMSEAAEQPAVVYEKYLSTRCGWIVMPTTPKQKAVWLRDLADAGDKNPEIGVERFRYMHHTHKNADGTAKHDAHGRPALYCANPDYDYDLYWQERSAAHIRAMEEFGKNAQPEDDPYFAEQFDGQWVFYTGRVLPFSRRRHRVASDAFGELSELRIGVSCDLGYEDGSVALFWAILPGPSYFIFDAIYEKRLTSEKLVERIGDKLKEHKLEAEFYCGDPRKPEVERVMRDAGLPIFTMDKNAQSDRAAGYRRLIDLLSEGPFKGYPGLYVSERCEKVMKEWEEVHYREGFRNEYSETAILGADHAIDAARYFLMTRSAPAKPAEDTTHPVDRFLAMRRRERANGARSPFHYQIGADRYAA